MEEMKKEKPVVSICTLTYNQEKYIRKCLDGILAQQTDFPFEIIVHDDASTDSTPAIIAEYAEKYPGIVKPIYQQENQYAKGLVYIYHLALQRAQGDYVAICEGDDYWIDPQKLQKQVDFLLKHKDYTMVHTRCRVLYDNDQTALTHLRKREYSGSIFRELVRTNFIYSPTTLFSRALAQEAIASFLDESINRNWMTADLPLWLYIASKSKIGFIDEVMSVYRVSRSSISNTCDRERRWRFDESMLEIRRSMMERAGVSGYFFNRIMTKYTGRLYLQALRSENRQLQAAYRKKFLKNTGTYLYKPHWYLRARFPVIEHLIP